MKRYAMRNISKLTSSSELLRDTHSLRVSLGWVLSWTRWKKHSNSQLWQSNMLWGFECRIQHHRSVRFWAARCLSRPCTPTSQTKTHGICEILKWTLPFQHWQRPGQEANIWARGIWGFVSSLRLLVNDNGFSCTWICISVTPLWLVRDSPYYINTDI